MYINKILAIMITVNQTDRQPLVDSLFINDLNASNIGEHIKRFKTHLKVILFIIDFCQSNPMISNKTLNFKIKNID